MLQNKVKSMHEMQKKPFKPVSTSRQNLVCKHSYKHTYTPWNFRHLWDYSTQRALRYLKSSPHPSTQLLTTLSCLKLHLTASSFLLFILSPLFFNLSTMSSSVKLHLLHRASPESCSSDKRFTACLHACVSELFIQYSFIQYCKRQLISFCDFYIYKQPNYVLNIHKY